MRMRCNCDCLDKELKVPTGPLRLAVILPLGTSKKWSLFTVDKKLELLREACLFFQFYQFPFTLNLCYFAVDRVGLASLKVS